MTKRNLLATGLAALAGVLAFTGDASAFGKRKKNRGGGCDDCTPAPVYTGGCGGNSGCSGCGTAMGPGGYGGYAVAMPDAMPAVAGATAATPYAAQPGVVTPASGIQGGAVVPATGTALVPQTRVMPAGGYVTPGGYYQNGAYVTPAGGYYQNGSYVTPAGYGTVQSGFGSGVVQGALGVPSTGYGYGSTVGGTVGNYAGQQVGRGLFRRR